MHKDDTYFRGQSDDLLVRMRALAGTGNLMDATWILNDMARLVGRVHRHDAIQKSDDSRRTKKFVMEMVGFTINWVKHIPEGSDFPKHHLED